MSKLTEAFKKGTALIPFITAGDPDLETTRNLVMTLEKAGADIIELGVPFSDPQADGPVIQAAGQRALEAGTTLASVIKLARELKGIVKVPIVLMGYYNPIMKYGEKRFAVDAAEAGISGVIIPDLPFDEGDSFYQVLEDHGLEGILMVSPNTGQKRLKAIASRARGFVYCVSMLGVTGTEGELYQEMGSYIDRVRAEVSIPLALGFGIDGPKKASQVAPIVDGVVVGSAIVKIVESHKGSEEALLEKVGDFVKSLKSAVSE